jgi:hypothetical protein
VIVIERWTDCRHHRMACVAHRAVAVIVMTAVLAALAFLVLGIAVSIAAFLLIVMPAVAIVVLMAWFFQPRTR